MSKPNFCWSTNGENYQCTAASIDEACGAAIDDIESCWDVGETINYWIAEAIHPIDAYGEKALIETVGEHAHNQINEWLGDEMFAEEEPLNLTDEDQTELGRIIVQFYRDKGKVQWSGVTNLVKHVHTVGEE